jgi:hypothetical protein
MLASDHTTYCGGSGASLPTASPASSTACIPSHGLGCGGVAACAPYHAPGHGSSSPPPLTVRPAAQVDVPGETMQASSTSAAARAQMRIDLLPRRRIKYIGGPSTCKNVSLRSINFENAFFGLNNGSLLACMEGVGCCCLAPEI